MEGVPQPLSLRRTPVQQRSAERLARILDACAELLEETGYEDLSTRAVAERAGVPIGSVYRFFSNKRAMAAALAHRNLDSYAERIGARLAALPGIDAYGAIDAVLDEYIAMKRTVPGFALVDFGVPGPVPPPAETSTPAAVSIPAPASAPVPEGPSASPEPPAPDEPSATAEAPAPDEAPVPDRDPNHLVADRLCELLATHLGRTADSTLRRKVLVGVEATDALLQLAFRTSPAGDPGLIAETRRLLHAYLAPVLG
ncbi:TetR/AcrR family transcriptional regulator [Streptomyces sp. SP18CS02]|uniref:TetR/AcrR family transcriptional regulator n=1 Tax=Streptomyces sp. SP18CS02 TaxID=3002531 RepID=UPI002E7A6460|nr:TetR/AcrR family transcriptional regulator [Streptomyces sp. SP18CS02]MEE1752476.1 TetR/AcrR family transcriptional regulator [Streptomyces sp. SP18CS02]